jgi:hypothetical protein
MHPGTGTTMVLKVVLDIVSRFFPSCIADKS